MRIYTWTTLASSYKDTGEYKKAIDVYNKILRIDPNNYSALSNLGVLYIKIDSYRNAIHILEHALEIKSKNNQFSELQQIFPFFKTPYVFKPKLSTEDLWYYLGFAYSEIGELNKAIEAYNRTLKINSNQKYAWNRSGYIYNKLGEHDKAIEACMRAIEIDPKFANPWNH
ncbi:MAG: tetratricopeptide repeat protein [Promethearchaeota archaeon]